MSTLSDTVKEFINIAGLKARIGALETELTLLKRLQASLGTQKRGRKPGSADKTAGLKRTKRGKRSPKGKLGESIVKFLNSKGGTGAHVNEIATHLKIKPANVTAWFYGTGKKKTKKLKPATFALVK